MNLEEDAERYHLKMLAHEAREKLPSLPQTIGGVVYDAKDLRTRLLGEEDPKVRLLGESARDNRDLEQLYRKEDGQYFFYSNVGLYEPIDTETAHTAMNTTIGYRRFLTNVQKNELEKEDERTRRSR